MNKEKRPLPPTDNATPSVQPVPGEPTDALDQVNKYGTYEVQDTTDTDNVFPTIGYPGSWKTCLDLPDIPPRKP